MSKKLYLTILAFIELAAILFGCIYHLGGLGLKLPAIHLGSLFEKSSVTESAQTALDSFDEIELDASVMNLTIVPGETWSYATDCSEKLAPTVKVSGNKLIVEQKKNVKLFPSLKQNQLRCDMKLTVPKDVTFSEVSLDIDMGDMKLNGIQAKELTLSESMGNITLTDSSAKTVRISNDLGNVTIRDCAIDDLDAELDMGNAEASLTNGDYGYDLSTDLGNIKVNGEKQKSTYRSKGSSDRTIKIHDDMGNIEIETR